MLLIIYIIRKLEKRDLNQKFIIFFFKFIFPRETLINSFNNYEIK